MHIYDIVASYLPMENSPCNSTTTWKDTEEITTENVIYGLLGLEYPIEQCFY